MAGDAVWLDVLPSMAGFATALAQGSAKAATDAGKSSGVAWAKSFAGAAGDSGSAAVVAELETAAKRTKRAVEEQTAAIGRARAAQKDAAAKVVLAEKALADAREKGDVSKIEAAELRLGAARDRQGSAAAKLVAVEDQLKAAHRENATVTEQLEKATSDLASQTDTQTTAVGRAKSGYEGAASSLGGMVVKLAAAAGAVALLSQAWGQAMEGEAATDRLAASLDLTAEQSARAGEVAGGLYADAYGDSIGEVSSAVGAVMSSISGMSDASAGELESVSAAALNIADVFGVDVAESARNVGIWIKDGLVADATAGFDLMTATLQKVPEALRGEVIDAGQEYSTFFAQLGLSGEQAMGLLVTASEGGQYAVDKTGDALKELTIRATDMSATSVSAYEAAGLSAEDMSARFLAGGDVAAGALTDLVAGLQGIQDPTERANAAIALFGTPLEDLGTENIPAFLDSLAGMGGGLGDVAGSAAEMGDVLNDNVATSFESVKRGFMDTLTQGIEPFLGPALSVLTWIKDTEGVLPAVGIALGVLATAWGVYTVAQWAANSAMLASPLTWIVVGIAALAAGIVLAVQNWGTITDWLREKWEPIGEWFAGIWEGITSGVSSAWEWIQTALAAGWDFIQSYVLLPWQVGFQVAQTVIETVVNAVVTAWQWVTDALSAGWDWINTYVFEPIKFGISLVGAAFQWYWDLAVRVWEGVRSAAGTAWDWVNNNVIAPFKLGIEAIGTVFDTTATWIGTAWDRVKEAAAAPVRFVVNTIYRDGIKATWDRIASAVGISLSLPTITLPFADGGVHEDHSAQISPAGAMRLWAEPETGGEAYIPLAPAKRARSVGILGQVADRFGMQLVPFADGGFWDSVGGVVSGIGAGVRNLVVTVADFLTDPANAIKDAISTPVEALLSQVGGGRLGELLVELPRQAIVGVIEKAKSLIASMFGSSGAGGQFTGALGGWRRPSSGPITSAYGMRNGAFHNGVDFGGNLPVYAANTGLVVATGNAVGYGNTGLGVRISHGGGLESYYGHADPGEILVRPGQTVTAGQHISWGGNTGNSTGQHLHFSLFQNRRAINPMVFDNGGYLLPQAAGVNLTNAPEPVLTAQQWQDVHTLAMRAPSAPGDTYNVSVQVDPSDLAGLRSVEEFTAMLRRRTRQAVGS